MRHKKWHVLLNKEMYAYLMYRVKRKSCLNTYTSEISATDKRIPSLQEDLANFWPFPRLVIQFVSLFAENSYFLSPALFMSLGFRNLFAVINTAPCCNSYVRFSSEALGKMIFLEI